MAIYVYNAGNSTQGKQVQDFYSRIARKKIDQLFNFSKFANYRDMMSQKSGEIFKTSTYFWSIHREVIDKDGHYTGVKGGYIAERDLAEISKKLQDMQVTQEGVYKKDDIYQLGTFRKVTFETKMKKFAGIVEITEDVETYSEDAVRALTVEDVTMQMNLAYNDLMMQDILNGEFVVYGGDATSRDEVGGSDDTKSRQYSLTEALTIQVFNKLVQNKAKPMSHLIAGQNRIGTKPIPEAFYIIVGADLYGALINPDLFPDFQPIETYSDPTNVVSLDGLKEIGRLGRFRILYSETLGNWSHQGHKVDDGSNPSKYCFSSKDPDDDDNYHYDVYPCIVMAKDAISTVGLQGKTKQEIFTRFPEVIDNGNPIGERGYVAFKFRYATVITRPDHLARLEVTCPIPN